MTCIGPPLVAELVTSVKLFAPAQGGPPQLRRVTIGCVSNSRKGGRLGAPGELEEVPMPIVGGLDIHRKPLTFDYLGPGAGEVSRGQIVPADRPHLRGWLARFAGRDDVAFALEGYT